MGTDFAGLRRRQELLSETQRWLLVVKNDEDERIAEKLERELRELLDRIAKKDSVPEHPRETGTYSTDPETYREILRPLNGHMFSNFRDVQEAIIEVFNANLQTFPPGYAYSTFIRWAKNNNWIRGSNHRGFLVLID